jgi:hypothetical protein
MKAMDKLSPSLDTADWAGYTECEKKYIPSGQGEIPDRWLKPTSTAPAAHDPV